jgi:hypothetical protein
VRATSGTFGALADDEPELKGHFSLMWDADENDLLISRSENWLYFSSAFVKSFVP